MRIRLALCIFLFLFVPSHVVESCSCFQKNRKKIVQIYPEELDNPEIEQIALENLSGHIEEVKSDNRSFLIKLEETIENCPFNSTCSEYKFFNNEESNFMDVRFNCDSFGIAAFFHTTTTDQKYKCTLENIASFMRIDSITKTPTTNFKTFLNELSHKKMENKMCLICFKKETCHAMALEVRKNGFYIHNSWQNSFSNSWFSGLTNENEFNLSPKIQNVFHEYRAKYGLQKCLTKKDLENCLKDMRHILNVAAGEDAHKYKEKKMSFEFICKELNKDFKLLTD